MDTGGCTGRGAFRTQPPLQRLSGTHSPRYARLSRKGRDCRTRRGHDRYPPTDAPVGLDSRLLLLHPRRGDDRCPAGYLRLSSETRFSLNPAFEGAITSLGADEYLIAEALQLHKDITVDDARKILQKKTIFPVIQRLLNKGVLMLREELQEKFKPRRLVAVRLTSYYREDGTRLKEAFELLDRSERQMELLMAFVALQKSRPFVSRRELISKAEVTDGVLRSLVKRDILEVYERETSRISGYEGDVHEAEVLTPQQVRALGK